MKNRIIPIEKLESLIWKPGDVVSSSNKGKDKTPAGSASIDDFFVEETTENYVLHNVLYNGETYSLSWTKELLDNRKSHIQDDWVKITDKLPNAKMYYASFLALHKNKDGKQSDLVEKVRKMFAKDFKNHWMMTSSRINYQPTNQDKVIHNYRSDAEDTTEINFVGPNNYVNSKNKQEKEMNALLGTEDCKEIEQVIEWISGKKPYLYRINNKPTTKEERAVVLGIINFGNFLIVADEGMYNGPARGVVATRQNFP